MGSILTIILILVLVGALPTWPHSRSWGYYPSGGLGLVLLIVIILLLLYIWVKKGKTVRLWLLLPMRKRPVISAARSPKALLRKGN